MTPREAMQMLVELAKPEAERIGHPNRAVLLGVEVCRAIEDFEAMAALQTNQWELSYDDYEKSWEVLSDCDQYGDQHVLGKGAMIGVAVLRALDSARSPDNAPRSAGARPTTASA